MGTIRPSTGFLVESGGQKLHPAANRNLVTYGCLLNDDVLDVQVVKFKTLGISVSLSVLQ